MKYCKKCVMPDTRPGISFNEEGVCSACLNYENRKNIDYKKRWEEFKLLCDKYRRMNGANGYDCMIAVSGGKDSHFQVYIMKEVMGMNPLLVTVEDNFPMTRAGMHNLKNISEAFGCDIISMKPNIKAQKVIMRYTFENYGKPTYFIDRYIYTYPLYMALKFNTPLLIYGENVGYEYGGAGAIETYSARDQIYIGVCNGLPTQELLRDRITMKDLNFFEPPTQEQIASLDPVYMSYFVEWNSFKNYEIICLNDGSTDGTLEILNKYQSLYPYIQVFTGENHGVAYQRNKGVQRARGKYIYYLDGDDLIKENCLETLYQYAEADSLDILYFEAESF